MLKRVPFVARAARRHHIAMRSCRRLHASVSTNPTTMLPQRPPESKIVTLRMIDDKITTMAVVAATVAACSFAIAAVAHLKLNSIADDVWRLERESATVANELRQQRLSVDEIRAWTLSHP
jgi:hypothetical protein